MTLTLCLAALALSGCGFTPLYATPTGVAPAMASVRVDAPPTRVGQLLREELEDAFARSEGGEPRYTLALDVQERRFARGLRVDDTANRYELRLTVRYVLTEVGTRRPLARSSRPVFVTYDVADQPYAGVAAGLDGEERAAAEIARVIRTDVARVFAARS